MSFIEMLKSFLQREPDSKEIAKERLRLVLIHDRSNISPEFLDKIKEDIIGVISSYMEVDEENTSINFHQAEGRAILEANLAVKELRRS